MKLFGRKDKTCHSSSTGCCKEVKESSANSLQQEVLVLGACCAGSLQTYENVKLAMSLLGLNWPVTNVGDFQIIASYGVMSTPGLVVNGKVVSQGRKLSVDEAKKLIINNIG